MVAFDYSDTEVLRWGELFFAYITSPRSLACRIKSINAIPLMILGSNVTVLRFSSFCSVGVDGFIEREIPKCARNTLRKSHSLGEKIAMCMFSLLHVV